MRPSASGGVTRLVMRTISLTSMPASSETRPLNAEVSSP